MTLPRAGLVGPVSV